MPLSVNETLDILRERKAKDDAKLFSKAICGEFSQHKSQECACISLKQMEVSSSRIYPLLGEKSQILKIVAIVETFNDSDYLKCLTVKDVKNFLENVEDKSTLVCVATSSNIESGLFFGVINAHQASKEDDLKNEKLRKLFGANIFHLWI